MTKRNKKYIANLPMFILLIMALFSVLIFKSSGTFSSFSNDAHNGDLIVDGNTTLLIENTIYNLIGNLMIRDNAAVIIKNCFFNQSSSYTVGIFVEDMAKLVVINTTLFISQNDITKISISDSALLNITDSILINNDESFYVWSFGNAIVYLKNCIIKGGFWGGRVIGDENSTVYVKNSIFDSLVFWAYSAGFVENVTLKYGLRVFSFCSVSVKNLNVGYVTAEGASLVNIRDSNVHLYVSSGGTSKILLMHSFVNGTVHARNNSTIWLIDSIVKGFREEDGSMILIGWELPIIGIIAFHHKLMPILWMVAISVITVIIFVII